MCKTQKVLYSIYLNIKLGLILRTSVAECVKRCKLRYVCDLCLRILSEWKKIVGIFHRTFGHCRGQRRRNCKGRITKGILAYSGTKCGEGFVCDPRWYVVLFCLWSYCVSSKELVERPGAIGDVRRSFAKIDDFLRNFGRSLKKGEAPYLDKLTQWCSIIHVSLEYLWLMQMLNPFTCRVGDRLPSVEIKAYYSKIDL